MKVNKNALSLVVHDGWGPGDFRCVYANCDFCVLILAGKKKNQLQSQLGLFYTLENVLCSCFISRLITAKEK